MALTAAGSPQEADGNKQERASPVSLLRPWRLPLAPPMGSVNTEPTGKVDLQVQTPSPSRAQRQGLHNWPDVLFQVFWLVHLRGGCELLEVRGMLICVCVLLRA